MNPSTAKKILRLADRATARILASVRRVKENAPEHAALHYRDYALGVLDPLSDIVFGIWARFPELEPPSQPGVLYYDPDKWNMPKAEGRRAARELRVLALDLERLVQLLAPSQEAADKRLQRAAMRAQRRIATAAFAVRQQDPEFRAAQIARIRRRTRAGRN